MTHPDDYKPRPPRPVTASEILGPIAHQDKGITTLINEIPDKSVRRRLKNFVESFDFKKVTDFKDISKGYQGALELSLYLGPEGERWRKTIELVLKCLDGFTRSKKMYLELDFPKELQAKFDDLTKQMCLSAKGLMTDDNYREFLSRMGQDDTES